MEESVESTNISAKGNNENIQVFYETKGKQQTIENTNKNVTNSSENVQAPSSSATQGNTYKHEVKGK